MNEEEIPNEIDDGEEIARTIFSPINLHNDLKRLRPNAFKPTPNSNEISVNRLKFSTFEFFKALARKSEDPNNKRNYFGFALLFASEIRRTGAKVIYTKKPENPYHADILVDYIVEPGKPLPAEIQLIANELSDKARLFKDNCPNSLQWSGESI